MLSAAKRSLKRKVAKRRNRISNPTNKKWFDKDCRIKRHAIRKLASLKRRNPTNSDIRTSSHETLSEYKQLLKKKRENYKNDKLKELTTNQSDSQNFWSVFKFLSETAITETTAPIKESEWLQHFGKLHSFPNQDHPQQQSIREELKSLEKSKAEFDELDFPISGEEILNVSKSLKNKKAPFSDLIKNKMIKASCGFLLNAHKKLFNTILQSGIYTCKQLLRGARNTYF